MNIKDYIYKFIPPIIIDIYHRLRKKSSSDETVVVLEKNIAIEYINQINNRKLLPFTDIQNLSKNFIKGAEDSLSNNGKNEPIYYGNFYTLTSYLNILPNIPPERFTIQHGFHFEGRIPNNIFNDFDYYLCWGLPEKLYYENRINCNIEVIGSPFLYAESLLSQEEIDKEKKRLGRNLLVFPTHSLSYEVTLFDNKNFLEYLINERKKFDTVRICLYWADICNGRNEIYEKNGFECVCAGNIYDFNFLGRLKSLISIADCTFSNDMGSHVGYSIIMNKPHCLINQNVRTKMNNGLYHDVEGEQAIFIKKAKGLFENNFDYLITNNQVEFVNKYWGVLNKKSKKDLLNILNVCYKKGNFSSLV